MGLTHLRKFSTTYYKDKVAAVDLAQIPAASATVNVYKQGASATSGTTVTTAVGGVAVTVRSPGGLVLNDTVQLGTDATKQMIVEEITSETSIKLRSTIGSDITVAAADRFVPYSNRPTLYSESTGVATVAGTPTTSTDSNGFVKFYITERVFDVVVSGSGLTTALYVDEESGPIVPRRIHYNVMDFVTPAAAIAAIPAGSKLYFPAESGPFMPPSAAGWTITQAIEIFSDGTGVPETKGFQYFDSAAAANKNSTIFTISPTSHVYIRDATFSNGVGAVSATDGTGDAIRLNNTSALSSIAFERLNILYAGRSGIRTLSTSAVNQLTLATVQVRSCKGDGIYLEAGTPITITGCRSTNNHKSCLYLKSCGGGGKVQIEVGGTISGAGLTSTTLEGTFVLDTCADIMVHGCNVEGFTTNTVKNGLVLIASKGCVIGGNEFDNVRIAANLNSRAIYIRGNSYGNTVLSNLHADVHKMVEIDSTADEGNTVFAQANQGGDANGPGTMVLPAGGRNFAFYTNISGGFNDKKGVGMLLPSMPGVTNIDSTVTQDGLLVYDSNPAAALKIRIGGVWKTVTVS